ncbi:hypothetical protein Tco_1246620 [Tanacetum coccineum]
MMKSLCSLDESVVNITCPSTHKAFQIPKDPSDLYLLTVLSRVLFFCSSSTFFFSSAEIRAANSESAKLCRCSGGGVGGSVVVVAGDVVMVSGSAIADDTGLGGEMSLTWVTPEVNIDQLWLKVQKLSVEFNHKLTKPGWELTG